jgi:hypothetical protein
MMKVAPQNPPKERLRPAGHMSRAPMPSRRRPAIIHERIRMVWEEGKERSWDAPRMNTAR